jgi:hypothetical protein
VADGAHHRHQQRGGAEAGLAARARDPRSGQLREGRTGPRGPRELHLRPHYCSVDDKANATTLACGYFESGIRVFDIRDPLRPREIAYYNPPRPMDVASPGFAARHARPDAKKAPDWCSAQLHLDPVKGELWTTCQDNGFMVPQVHQRRVAVPLSLRLRFPGPRRARGFFCGERGFSPI